MIVKPSPFTPLCNIKIVEQAQKFLPKGVLQVVVGDDQLGPWVTEHPGIQRSVCCTQFFETNVSYHSFFLQSLRRSPSQVQPLPEN